MSGILSDVVIRYFGVDQVCERKGEDEDVVGFQIMVYDQVMM